MTALVSKRTVLATLLGLTVFGAVVGSAASLGGLTSPALGAGATVVAACDTDGVSVSYTQSYSTTAPAGYKVTAVTVSDVADSCDGQTISVTLSDAADTSLASGTVAVPTSAATSHAVSLTPAAAAGAVTKTHVVIA